MESNKNKKAIRLTIYGLICNTFLFLLKLYAGFIGNSSAIIADGFHSLSDLSTDIFVIFGLKVSEKPPDEDHRYGHGKVETLVTFLIGLFLSVVGLKLLWNGFSEIWLFYQGNVIESPGWLPFVVAIFSILIKEILFYITAKEGKRIGKKSIIANAWHHRTDSLSSIGVALGILGAKLLGENWNILDPIAAIIVSGFILYAAYDISRSSLDELLEKSLGKKEIDFIFSKVNRIKGVYNPHSIKTRRIGSNLAIDLHIDVERDLNVVEAHNIATSVEIALQGAFEDRVFVSVHVEPKNEIKE